jgi:hypothetical protein
VDIQSTGASAAPLSSLGGVGSGLLFGGSSGGTLTAIAGELGVTLETVQSALERGGSLADLAEQQGVSRSSLATLVGAHVQSARLMNGQAPLDGHALERMVTRTIDRRRGADTPNPSLPGYGSAPPASTGESEDARERFSVLA